MIKADKGKVVLQGDTEQLVFEMVITLTSFMSGVCGEMPDEEVQELCTFIFNTAWQEYKGVKNDERRN